jgi:DNA transformation protein
MGEKGAKMSQGAGSAVEQLVDRLGPIGEISSRKMFGGYGVFESGTMFALVNSAGVVHLKVDDSNRSRFEEAGSERHGRMPYFQIPADVLSDEGRLREWAAVSIAIAHAAKKK